jgi:hypothetical protein
MKCFRSKVDADYPNFQSWMYPSSEVLLCIKSVLCQLIVERTDSKPASVGIRTTSEEEVLNIIC